MIQAINKISQIEEFGVKFAITCLILVLAYTIASA